MTCEHPNADGIDGADMDDPYKVWVCGTCHHRFTEAGGDLEEADYPIELAHVLHSADGTNMAAFHELTGDKRDAYLNMARAAREHIEAERIDAEAKRDQWKADVRDAAIARAEKAEAKVEEMRKRLWTELGHQNADTLRCKAIAEELINDSEARAERAEAKNETLLAALNVALNSGSESALEGARIALDDLQDDDLPVLRKVKRLTAERDIAMKAAATERLEADMLRRNRDKYQERSAEVVALRADLAEAKAERNRAWAECEKVDAEVSELSAKRAALTERLRFTELAGSRDVVRWKSRYEALRADLVEQSRRPKRVLGSVMADFLLRLDDTRAEAESDG